MSQPAKIQISLQGGGAKLVYLMAALRGIRELEDQGIISVVRLSGTSAGALAACLYASGKPWPDAEKVVKDLAKDAATDFTIPNKFRIFSALVMRQKPLWSDAKIRKKLSQFFRDQVNIEDLNIPVKIVSSNLTTCNEHVHGEKDAVIDAIMDSSGIPFFFRHLCQRVDGGLCSNLPVLQLLDNNFKDIPSVALSFPTGAQSVPEDNKNFLRRLVGVSIDNGVSRSRDLADFVCDLKEIDDDEIDTLSFEKASEMMLGNKYQLLANKVASQFKSEILPNYPKVVERKSKIKQLESDLEEARSGVYKIYSGHLKEQKIIHSLTYEIVAYSVGTPGALDLMSISMKFSAIENKPIRALEFHVEAPFRGRGWTLKNDNGEKVDATVFPARNTSETDGKTYVTVVVVPETPLNSGKNYILSTEEECHCLEELLRGTFDVIGYVPQDFVGTVGEVTLAVHFPSQNELILTKHNDCPNHFTEVKHPEQNGCSKPPLGYSTTAVRSLSVDSNGLTAMVVKAN